MRLLVIEDSELQQAVIAALFSEHQDSIRVEIVGTLAEASKKLEDADFIVLDLSLPDSTPDNSLSWLAGCGKPSLVVSCYDDKVTIMAAAAAGASGFISKGNLADQIVASIYFAMAREDLAFEHFEQRREACRVMADRLKERCFSMSGD